jgi:hypothetical protein
MPRKNQSPSMWTPPAKKHRRVTKPKKPIFPREKPKRVERRAKSKDRTRWD